MSEDTVVTTDLSQMSDEEVMNMAEGDIVVAPASEDDAGVGDPADSAGDDELKRDNPDDDTGGADDDEDSPEDEPKLDPFAEKEGSKDDSGNDDPEADADPEADQAGDKDTDAEGEDDPDDEGQTYEAMYNELMAPFRAAKREIKLDNIKDARRLLKMGVDYSQKMQKLKPQLRTLRTLESAGLTDPSRINFLIDLDKKDPAAIRKLLKVYVYLPAYRMNGHIILFSS